MTPTASVVVGNEVEIDQTAVAVAGGIGSFLIALVTAFFALRRTVIEATSAENQSFFQGLRARLDEVEKDLEAEKTRTTELREELISVREELSLAKLEVAELRRINAGLELERNDLKEEREELAREIRELENRIDDLENTSLEMQSDILDHS